MDAESAIGSLGLEVAAWVVTYALHSTVLLLAALVAFAWIGHAAKTSPRIADAAPAWRECIGKVALLAGIVTAGAQTALGIQPFGWRPALVETAGDQPAHGPDTARLASAAREPAAESSSADSASAANVRAELPPLPSWPAIPLTFVPIVAALNLADELPRVPEDSAPMLRGSVGAAGEPAALPSPTPAPRITSFLAAFFAVWAVVACAAALRRLAGWRALQRSLAGSTSVTDPGVLARFDELCRRAGVRHSGTRRVELRVAPLLASPMSRGFLRHEICVPPRALRDLDDEEFAALLGHELAHVARRDPAWLVVFRVIEVVFCLQPLNRIVARRLEDDAELLCDDRAVVWTGERIPLASCLTEVASWLVHTEREPRLATQMAAHGARLSRRVERLVDDGHSPDDGARRPLSTAVAVAFAGAAIAIVPGFAAQSAKPLPLDLQFELALAAQPAGHPSPSNDAAAPSNDAAAPANDADAPSNDADAPSIDAAAPANAALEAPNTPVEASAEEPLEPADLAAFDAEPEAFPFAPSTITVRAVESPLADVLRELDREVEQLRAKLLTREGGASLAVDLDALAARIEGLRARATWLTARPNILLSPDEAGRSAEEHNP